MAQLYVPHPYKVIERPKGVYTLYESDQRIGRFTDAVRAIRKIEALQEKGRIKIRKCMCCPRKFESTGPGHRLCGSCRTKTEGLI